MDEGSFTVLWTNDIAASAFADPADGATKLSGSTFSPQAIFENAGTASQSGVSVRYKIIGPLPGTSVVYEATASIASLSPGSSQAVTFASTSLSTGGTYTIQAIAQLGTDQNSSNDTRSGTLVIAAALSGTYDVGSAQPAPFNTLTGAIGRLNSVGVAGPVTFRLVDASYGPPNTAETFPININAYSGAGPANLFTLKPAPGVTPTLHGSTSRALIVMNGADYVTIDGSNQAGGTTRDLTLVNLSTNAASAVIWGQTTSGGDPATNVTVKNAVLSGNDNNQTLFGAGFGGTTISLTSSGTGNNNNRVQNCLIKRVQYGVYSAGAGAANKNTGTVVTQNNMDAQPPDNLSKGGVFVRFEDGVQISENRIVGLSTFTTTTPVGIALGLTSVSSSSSFAGDEVTNATVSRNFILGVVSTNGFGLSAAGIVVAQASSGTTTIVNNMVSGMMSSALDPDLTVGIFASGGTGSTTRIIFSFGAELPAGHHGH